MVIVDKKNNGRIIVKRFIFSSSQSMYGISELDSELDEDNSEKNPVTVYASAKWDAEQALNSMSCREFIVTSFRWWEIDW